MSSKQYFDGVAHQWDSMREGFFSGAVREKALAVAGVQRGEIAADIGTGTGFITEELIRQGLQVIAIDESEAMLETMRKKFLDVKDIDYRIGGAEALPIPSNSVDYAFANMYLHHVESPSKAIVEMVRILRPGGKVVLTDLDVHHNEFLQMEHHDRWMGFMRQDILQWFTEAGLKNVAVSCAGEDCCAKSCCGNDSAKISIFVASGEK